MKKSTIEFLSNLLESEEDNMSKKTVVVYGGRFQPFHKGHYQAYKWLCKKFGKGNVWIATSDSTNFDSKTGSVSPFGFEEKKEIITTLYEIDPRKIVECKNPAFSPKEVFKLYKNYRVIYIAAVGKKDVERYIGTFFKPLPSNLQLPEQEAELLTLKDDTGYYVEVPTRAQGVSGTLVREDLIASIDNDKDRKKLFIKYFGKYNATIDELITARLKEVK